MSTYIRFQIPVRRTTAAWPLGIFRSLDWLEDEPGDKAHIQQRIIGVTSWFNSHLTVPATRDFSPRALFWFRPDARVHVAEAWNLTAALREAGIVVQTCRTRCPGRIVYDDPYQIAAIPYWPYHRFPQTHTARTYAPI